jgi:putative glutamine amidotransferase
MTRQPRIGITTSFNEGEQRLDLRYVRAVEAAGGLPLIVPMLESDERARAFADLLDALIITGGPAITEGLVGELPGDIDLTDPVRVESDRRVLAAFRQSRKPVLGICYGMQLVNAVSGGTIYADVQAQLADAGIHSQKRGGADHRVNIEPGSHLARILGTDRIEANTHHVQAVCTAGKGFRVSARAPDGVVEAIESEDGRILGVQFHPERMGPAMQPLFEALVLRSLGEDSV